MLIVIESENRQITNKGQEQNVKVGNNEHLVAISFFFRGMRRTLNRRQLLLGSLRTAGWQECASQG